MDETTRDATLSDVEQVVLLLAEGRSLMADARGGPLWLARQAIKEPLDEAVGLAISGHDWLVQLAAIDMAPLGVLIAQAETIGSVTVAVVRELFVTPDARGVGLGELMMDAALEWAADRGFVGVDSYALPGDRATKNFFERFGLKARGIVVHRSIASR